MYLNIVSLASLATLATTISAQSVDDLEGTWSSKSNAVFTGPDFYDPIDELLIEPSLPGISYSFTNDGYWEEAIYQISANPKEPTCPSGVLIFQHGKYELLNNGTLILHPFEVDGRQLVSVPCESTESNYIRYNQTETFKSFEMVKDEYHGRYRLDLYQFDGAPLAPLYLAYKPPMMLPTITMNPTATQPEPTSISKRVRRSLENRSKTTAVKRVNSDFNTLWWVGVSMVLVGGSGWLLL